MVKNEKHAGADQSKKGLFFGEKFQNRRAVQSKSAGWVIIGDYLDRSAAQWEKMRYLPMFTILFKILPDIVRT